MIPTILWLVSISIGAVTAVSRSSQLSPTNLNVDGITAEFGDQCTVTESSTGDKEWFLSAHTTETIVDWAIQLNMQNALSTGLSTVAFTIDGEKVSKQGDIFMGFGNGNKYISFLTDFDGGVNNMEKVRGIQVYPECAKGGGVLAEGDISDVLLETNSYDNDTRYAVRDALAGGDRWNWEKLGGTTVHNGDTWPVTIAIVNDIEANEVTFRFTSNTTTAECTYEDAFESGPFAYGILPDTEDGDSDDFHIYSIGIENTDVLYSDRIANMKCQTYETHPLFGMDDNVIDDINNPTFNAKTETLAECQTRCETAVDEAGRICVAVEWKDGGSSQSTDTERECLLVWACSKIYEWSEGSVYMRLAEFGDIDSDSANGFGYDFDTRNIEGFGAMIGSASDNVVVTVTAKDLLVLGLAMVNVLTLILLICRCTKCLKGDGKKKTKYDFEAVAVLSENESLQI